jgi:2-phospho-L-lactate guanylyltransferase
VLVADLPPLRPEDIDAVVAEFSEHRNPLYVADHHGSGTTFLIHGPGRMPGIGSGRNSAHRHRRLGYREAQRPGRGLRADLDTPQDLVKMIKLLRV